jgi:8-oxoguanine DNA glycosylase, N-terminal domain
MMAASAAVLKPARFLRRGTVSLLMGDRLNLSDTFTNGQIWGWRSVKFSRPGGSSSTEGSTAWRGVVGPLVVSLHTAPTSESAVDYEVHCSSDADESTLPTEAATSKLLRDFLHADSSMSALHAGWSSAGDPRMATIVSCLPGMRILDQDPFECLTSFICSR